MMEKSEEAITAKFGRRLIVSLGVYAVVVTVGLVATIAGGAVYLNNLNHDLNICKETNNNMDTTALKSTTNEFEVVYEDAPNEPQKVLLNTMAQTEVFIQNGTVAVFDFLKNIGGFYSAEYNRCLLVGGIDARIKSPDDLKKELESMTGTRRRDAPTEKIRYQKSPKPVTDQSFLPDALAPFCKGRPTYWLTPATGDHGKRMKRANEPGPGWGWVVICGAIGYRDGTVKIIFCERKEIPIPKIIV